MTVVPPVQLPPIVLMGVSGAGKTVVGNALADASGRVFIDGDDLHSAANKEKMRAGIPLADQDREPWLRTIGERLAVGDGVIVACSALKRRYRDLLREYAPGVFFAHLDPERAALEERVHTRAHEYMPAGLLDSQLAALEPLTDDEFGAVFHGEVTVEQTVADIRAALAGDGE
ncbi:gluconokinase [Humibacter ginsenosidimutans]|uniref:Gluconokinase n=1 Tax=Humibacter ginsenosidimutans TaxID=2599293 RepID=A0A5B8M2K4_9MICO|nr:gluconokinase [Humibacter ginsenosidimutans]QDZ14476.1 gluconokinase [Humibacter ginsenosidimutans]